MLQSVLAHVLTLWSEREPGLEQKKPRIWVLSIFRVPKGQYQFSYIIDHCGFLVLFLVFLWITQTDVCQRDLICPSCCPSIHLHCAAMQNSSTPLHWKELEQKPVSK